MCNPERPRYYGIAGLALLAAAGGRGHDGNDNGSGTEAQRQRRRQACRADAADDLPRHAADAAGRLADAESGRQVAALHALDARTGRKRKQQTDLYLVSIQQGVSSTQADDVHEGEERNRRRAGRGTAAFFVFLSNREAPESAATRNQLYLMRADGGEARRITDAKEGVVGLRVQPRRPLARRIAAGKTGEEQLYRLPVARPSTPRRRSRSRKHPTGVGTWQWAPRQQAHLLRSPRTRSTRTRSCGARRSSPSTSATPRRRSPACGRSISIRAKTKRADRRTALTPSTTSRSPTTASGSASAAARRIATSATSPQENHLRGSVSAGYRAPAQIERLTNNDEVGESARQLLARQPVDRLLGARRSRRSTA